MSSEKIKTAMILAAGFGTRMKDLANHLPKALLQLGNSNLLHLNLLKLRNAGINTVVINLHHLGYMIKKHIVENPIQGLTIYFSEEEKILGTGGGIANAEMFFENEIILVINSDILSDLFLSEFINHFFQKKPLASIVVLPSRNYKEYSLVTYDDQKLTGFMRKNEVPKIGQKTAIFMGYQILTPQARNNLKPTFSSIMKDFYYPAVKQNQNVSVYIHNGKWFDVGNKEKYLEVIRFIETNKINLNNLV